MEAAPIVAQDQEQHLDKFLSIRRITEQICAPLEAEDTVVQPTLEINPPKWYLGHTNWFFEAFLLRPHLKGYKPFHPNYSFLFNSHFDSGGKRRVQRALRGIMTRPTVEEILEYRRYTDAHIADLLLREDTPDEVTRVFELCMQHEQQHQEQLLTDIKYILSRNPLLPFYRSTGRPEGPGRGAKPQPQYLEVPEGIYEIGFQGNGEDFAWDNELPQHKVFLPSFSIRNTLVTNGEYIEFINDGGYRNTALWLFDALPMIQNEKWEAPMYWQYVEQDGWKQFTLDGLMPVDPDEPVTHISFYEAAAFAAWAGKRLLTEQEWETASRVLPQSENGTFLESRRLHPDVIRREDSDRKLYQMLGDTWEWTYSGHFPYPGYRREEGLQGEHDGMFMINRMVLRGGSCVTPADHIRNTYRNYIAPDARWQFSGIRLAERQDAHIL